LPVLKEDGKFMGIPFSLNRSKMLNFHF